MVENEEISKQSGFILKDNEINLNSEPYIVSTEIDGLFLSQRPYYPDIRGGFQEDFRIPDLEKVVGHEIRILQVQASDSTANVFRGFHVDKQDKLLTPRRGHLLAIFVDMRPYSPSFKEALKVEFNIKEKGRRMSVFVPNGVANSFYVYPDSSDTNYTYCVTTTYDPENSNRAIGLNDSNFRSLIPGDNLIISNKDQNGLTAEEFIQKYAGDI